MTPRRSFGGVYHRTGGDWCCLMRSKSRPEKARRQSVAVPVVVVVFATLFRFVESGGAEISAEGVDDLSNTIESASGC